MNPIALQLESLTDEYISLLNDIDDNEFVAKDSPTKWSKKEEIGHLIDSAHNNIRRFIVAQYEDNPEIVYAQEKWVSLNDYQHWPTAQITQLWYLLNMQIVAILKNISIDIAQRTCQSEAMHTIQWLAEDYIKHLQHHIHHVLNLEPGAYP